MVHAFLEDIYPENFLYAVTVRSPLAKGRLKRIDFPELPEDYTAITSKDIPGENRLLDTEIPILAEDKLSYIGEPLALLLGPNKTILEELLRQCKVICKLEEEPPDFEPELNSEVAASREILIGDTQSFLTSSERLIESSYVTGIQDHWYAEPAGAVTLYETKNTLLVRTATQWTNHVKNSIMLMLSLDGSSVIAEPTSLNLHIDGKFIFPSHLACHAALGTYKTKKPVRLILNREEDFLFSPKRCKSNINIKTALDNENKITAIDIDITVNLGAYAVNAEEILDHHCLGVIGNYNFDNLKLTARAVKTNIPPGGPFSGFGISHGLFAMERHISLISDSINQNPALLRKEIINPRIVLPKGVSSKNQVPIDMLIDIASKNSDYNRKWSSYELLRQERKKDAAFGEQKENLRGIGISIGFQGNGMLYHGSDKGSYSVEVTLTKESALEIKTSIISSSSDYGRIWAKVASEIISIDPEMVRIVSQNAPDCGPSICSRNITVVTKLVEKCCLAIKKQLFHNPLPITVRRSIKPQYGSLWDGNFLPHEGSVMDISGFTKLGRACAVVDLTLDLIECIPKIRGIWLTVDGGKIISKNRARRKLSRSTVQALGWAFYESIEYKEGILPKYQYDNFGLPPLSDIPPVHIDFISNPSSDPKGIGELPFTCIPSAFLQAVSQAADHSFRNIPLNRKEIWDIVRLRLKKRQEQGTK